jgi:hypothetical protein
MEIPLRNRKKETIGYAKVSIDDYDLISSYSWHQSKKYIQGSVDGKMWLLHRFIMIHILKNDITSKQPVDHINNDSLDNTRENLRIVSYSDNSRNVKKKTGTSSQYIGVCKKANYFQASIRYNNTRLSAPYKSELHAAAQYDIWIDELNLVHAKKNNVEIPDDFIPWKAKQKNKDNLPKEYVKL